MQDGKFVMGVVGLGEGRSIISAALSSEYFVLGTICDLNEDLCKARCEEFRLDKYTTNYDDLLEDSTIDVIAIYTPDQFHAKHIRQALLAGKHVICTKPVLLDLTEAKELIECQKQSGKQVFVGQSTRFFEPVKQQRAQYDSGALGELVTIEAHYKSDARWFLDRPWSKKAGFSWMYNFMIHAVDLAAWYLPNIEEVFGYGIVSANTSELGLDVEDTLSFLAKDKSGVFATVEGSYATPCLNSKLEFPIECTLRGTKGISRGGYNLLLMHHKTLKPQMIDEKESNSLNAGKAKVYEEVSQSFEDMHDYYFRFEGKSHHAGEYQNYINHFAQALLSGTTPLPDLKEGVHTIAVMEAMSRSLKSGMPEKVSAILTEYGLSDFYTER